jgi:two-component system response regulator MtrA
MVKPFHPAELLARVRALARRANTAPMPERVTPQRIQALGLELDVTNQSAYLDGLNLSLTRLEFELLCQLVRYPGQVLSHGFLSEQIWGYKNVSDATLLKGHVSSIRQKVRSAGGNEEMIHTVHGVGYSFTPV